MKLTSILLVAVGAILSGAPLQAGIHVWSGGSTNRYWSNPANWLSNSRPVVNEAAPVILVFPASAASPGSIHDINGLQVDRIEVRKEDFTIESLPNALFTLRGNGLSLTNSARMIFRPRFNLSGSNVFGFTKDADAYLSAFGGSGSL